MTPTQFVGRIHARDGGTQQHQHTSSSNSNINSADQTHVPHTISSSHKYTQLFAIAIKTHLNGCFRSQLTNDQLELVFLFELRI